MILGKTKNKIEGMFKSREELDLTGGPVGKNLFYLSLPIVVMNLLQTAYNIADTFWLGQLSEEALAAITFAFPLVFFLISLGMGISVAGSVLVAQFAGSGKREKVDFAASQTITFSVIASVVLGFIGYFFIGNVITLLGASPKVALAATGYMQIISIGLLFLFGFFVFMSLMRGFGDTVTPMLLMFGSVILNIILDPFMIFGWWVFPAMGVEGAAIATVFSRALAMIAGFAILFSGRKGVTISFGNMVPDFPFLKKMLHIGIPATLEGTGRSISVNAIVAVVGLTFIDTVVAGFGIGIRIFSLIFLPAIAIGRGVETMTGQNLGAGNFDRAGETADIGAKYTFLILSGVGVITFLFAQPIAAVFTTSAQVASVAAEFLRYVSLSFGFIGVLRAYTGSFRGAGKTATAAVISVSTLALIRLPIAYFGAQSIGQVGVWAAFFISNIFGATVAFIWYRRGTWRRKVTEEERQMGEVAEEADEYESTVTENMGNRVKSSLETLKAELSIFRS